MSDTVKVLIVVMPVTNIWLFTITSFLGYVVREQRIWLRNHRAELDWLTADYMKRLEEQRDSRRSVPTQRTRRRTRRRGEERP